MGVTTWNVCRANGDSAERWLPTLVGKVGRGVICLQETENMNNFDYLGIYARHGRQASQPPRSPMTLQEGFNFVFNMVDKFFHYGATRNFVEVL